MSFDLSQVDPSLTYGLFKGEPGVRKSTEALTYPKSQYWFSFDQKMDALLLPMRKFGINPKEIQFDDYNDWNTARVKLTQFQLNCPFKTLVFDSITSIGDAALNQALRMKTGLKRQSGATAGKVVAGIPINELEDYNAESAVLQELVAITKDIHKFHKVNIILIAHVIQVDYKTIGGETHMSRSIVTAAKKIAAKIPAYCTEVYHFNIKKSFEADKGGQYALLTEHTGDDFARTALPLPKEIVFGDSSLYDNWVKPAIEEMKKYQAQINQPQTTNQPTTNKSFGVE